MVPADFRSFFVASAGVAGALIGLLFVALSVAPEWEEGDIEHRIDSDVRAGVAFVALVDALLVSLFALIPGNDLAKPTMVVAGAAAVVCIGFGVLLARSGVVFRLRRKLILIGAQTLVLLGQLLTASVLLVRPHSVSSVRALATYVVVLFLVGIFRAWQLIGARDIGLVTLVAEAIRNRQRRTKAHHD